MSKSKIQSQAENLAASGRREELVGLLCKAACRLAGISVNSPNSSRFCSKRADSSLTVLDLSSQIGINVCEDKPLDSKEL